MLPTPAITGASHSKKLNHALPKPYRIRNGNEQWDNKRRPALAVRFPRTRDSPGEEQAIVDIDLSNDPRVARECIGQEYVAKFSILRLCEAANADPLKCGDEPMTPIRRQTIERGEYEDEQKENVGLWNNLPEKH